MWKNVIINREQADYFLYYVQSTYDLQQFEGFAISKFQTVSLTEQAGWDVSKTVSSLLVWAKLQIFCFPFGDVLFSLYITLTD